MKPQLRVLEGGKSERAGNVRAFLQGLLVGGLVMGMLFFQAAAAPNVDPRIRAIALSLGEHIPSLHIQPRFTNEPEAR
jgi:hypothetical protein